MAKILLIEDDQPLAKMVSSILHREGHDVSSCHDGKTGIENLLSGSYNLCVLDWQLPGMTGVDICLAARQQGLTMPLLMLTARSSSDDAERGLDAGADDYLTKPFAPAELCARVKALLRRSSELNFDEIKCGDLRLCLKSGRVFKNDEPLTLMPAEHALLEFLLRNKGKVFSAEQLANHVWTSDADATYGAVATCIGRLRLKIDGNERQSLIKTRHGIGYVLEE